MKFAEIEYNEQEQDNIFSFMISELEEGKHIDNSGRIYMSAMINSTKAEFNIDKNKDFATNLDNLLEAIADYCSELFIVQKETARQIKLNKIKYKKQQAMIAYEIKLATSQLQLF